MKEAGLTSDAAVDPNPGAAPLPASEPAPTSAPERAPSQGGLRRAVRAFKHRDFAIFWSGALASNIGAWVQNMTVPYVLYDLTDSAFWVGFATFAQFAPQMLLGPVGGAIADRANRRKVLIMSQTLMAIVAAVLWLAWLAELRTLPVILGLVTLGGIIGAINIPSWQTFVNDLIEPEALISAITLNSLQFNASRALGPAIAGVILATAGPSWAFLVNAISYGFVIAALLVVRPRPQAPSSGNRAGVIRQFREAIAYSRRQRGILIGLIITILIAFLGNPVQSLTVVFAEDEFHVGPLGLAVLNVALGVGAVMAFFTVSGWDHITTRARMTLWSLVIYSVAIITFACSPNFGTGIVPLVFIGAGFLAVISIANTTTQYIVADHIRGRVLALRVMCFSSGYPVGALVQGWVTDLIGVRATVGGAGAILLLAALVLFRMPGLVNHLDDPHDTSPAPAPAA